MSVAMRGSCIPVLFIALSFGAIYMLGCDNYGENPLPEASPTSLASSQSPAGHSEGSSLSNSADTNAGPAGAHVRSMDAKEAQGSIIRPEGWTAKSHSGSAAPTPSIVFPQDTVNAIALKFDPGDWQALLDDMTDIYGEFGENQMGGPPMDFPPESAAVCRLLAEGDKCTYKENQEEIHGTCQTMGGGGALHCFSHEGFHERMMERLCVEKHEGDACTGKMGPMDLHGVCLPHKRLTCVSNQQLDACATLKKGDACKLATPMGDMDGACDLRGTRAACIVEMGPPGGKNGKGPAGPGAPGGPPIEFGRNPIWIPCTVTFQGHTWTHVGFRFKGNSTLAMTWGEGQLKMPFKLDFDRFEQEFPQIADQRFYGYQELSFANNMRDASCLREKVAGDLFRAFGIPDARRAFVLVSMDFGDGTENLGLFTMAEVPGKTLIKEHFGKTGGNLYKPKGEAATFAQGYPLDASSFPKESNKKNSDWSDIKALVAALHADHTDAAAWRADLEKCFDVDGFLKWLAANTVIQDWDTYGTATHNFYLYGNPAENGRLHWIPWDHNESMKGSDGMNMQLRLDMSTVTKDWPLIRFLMDDPVYQKAYWKHVRQFIDGPFSADSVKARMQADHDLIAPYLEDPNLQSPYDAQNIDPSAFAASLDTLFQHVDKRIEAASAALAQSKGVTNEQRKAP